MDNKNLDKNKLIAKSRSIASADSIHSSFRLSTFFLNSIRLKTFSLSLTFKRQKQKEKREVLAPF